MKCKKCGIELKDNEKYCSNCGFKIIKNIDDTFSYSPIVVVPKVNSKNKKRIIFSSILIVALLLSSTYYLMRIRPYNNLVSGGNKAVIAENYNEATILYSKAKNYQDDSTINNKIALIEILKKSKSNYINAINDMKAKNYLSAITAFNDVDKQDIKRYSIAQTQIKESKKQYIIINLNVAENDIKSGNFDSANVALNNIFKIDTLNKNATVLKNNIATIIKKQKDIAQAAEKTIVVAKAKAATIPKAIFNSNFTLSNYNDTIQFLKSYIKGSTNPQIIRDGPKLLYYYHAYVYKIPNITFPPYIENFGMAYQPWIDDPWVDSQRDGF